MLGDQARLADNLHPSITHYLQVSRTVKLAFVVQGLFEKSDSIGYDCVYQYKLACELFGEKNVRIFAEKFDSLRYPDVDIDSSSELHTYFTDPKAIIFYHFCDSWPELESELEKVSGRVIVRWHNNTPPWFFAKYSQHSVRRTIAGFQAIRTLATRKNHFFVCNSEFTRKQMASIGIADNLLSPVFPASRYLENNERTVATFHPIKSALVLKLLFVGRVVAHKGHLHIVYIAKALQDLFSKKVVVEFVGRGDDAARPYVDELRRLSDDLGVQTDLLGEIDADELDNRYADCDVFVCMSEHEGFGLPVYEAMARDIPVAVRNITAFQEILNEHPLAFSVVDYKEIAFQISRLSDPDFRQKVLRYQREEILPKYTKDIVKLQLKNVIEAALRYEPKIPDRISRSGPNFEIAQNYVTLYDIEAYTAFLTDNRLFGLVGDWRSQRITAERFFCSSGKIDAVPFLYKKSGSSEHAVFGPWMELPKGRYRVSFEFDVASAGIAAEPLSSGHLLLDAFSGSSHNSIVVTVDPYVEITASLEFVLDAPVSNFEFRVKPLGGESDRIVSFAFRGVTLSRIGVSDSVTSAAVTQKEEILGLARRHGLGEISVVAVNELILIEPMEDFIESCYQRIFGRPADVNGSETYSRHLRNGDLTKLQVVEALLNSEEGSRRVPKVITV